MWKILLACTHIQRERGTETETNRERQRGTDRDRRGTDRDRREKGEVHPGEVQKSILVQLSEYGFIKVTITFSFSFHS